MKAAAVLPARLASTRLPRKMLLADSGRALIEHSARNVLASRAFERVAVATDSPEILACLAGCAKDGIEAVMTSVEHHSGTDRVREAVERLQLGGFDVVVNVQGDEPELAHADLRALVDAFADSKIEMATLCAPLAAGIDASSAQIVKVVRDRNADALYFSRAAIPDLRHARADRTPRAPLRHIGVYAFRPAALMRFCALEVGELEREENLEQLRWLEAGGRIRVLDATAVPLGIDTREEYDAFVARLRTRGVGDTR